MKKKYLTTPEEVLALKDTDTKIYAEKDEGYYQFIQGTLFRFDTDGSIIVCGGFVIGKGFAGKYILVEEPVKEAIEKDRGMLCKFTNKYETRIGILACFTNNKKPVMSGGDIFDKCYKLTPAEVAEITGYKVEA